MHDPLFDPSEVTFMTFGVAVGVAAVRATVRGVRQRVEVVHDPARRNRFERFRVIDIVAPPSSLR